MMVCGGDKSLAFTTNDDGTLKSSRHPKCLCLKSTCIFSLMARTVACSFHGQTTIAASRQFEHEHVLALATMVRVFLLELVSYFDTLNDLVNKPPLGALDYLISQLTCHGATAQFGLPNVAAFTCVVDASRKEAVAISADVFFNPFAALVVYIRPSIYFSLNGSVGYIYLNFIYF